jgi:dimethylamine monooxygenase subunit A
MQAFPVICQSHLGVAPWMDPLGARLPGLQPVAEGEWLHRDDAFSGQMAYRDRLLAERRADVVAETAEIGQAERDLLDAVLVHIAADPAYRREGSTVTRPDGVAVPLDADRPLVTAARLVQEDMLVLEKGGSAHLLNFGVLCFPASWSLRQKLGRGMAGIHAPVERIDDKMNQRIERVLSALQPGNAVWRANVLCYNDPNLFQPRLESEKRPFDPARPLFVRVERQGLRRLSPSNAIVFTIHTWLTPVERLTPEQAASLPAAVRAGGSMGEPLHP